MASAQGRESIGERLRRLRLERGLSQRELSGPGVSYAYVSRIEAGARRPSVKALRTLAGRLRVSTEYLETGSELRASDERELRLAEAELQLRLGNDPAAAEAALAGILDEAIGVGDGAVAVRARIALGLAAAADGRDAEAVELLEEALAAVSLSAHARPDVYATLGRCYSNLGLPELAVELFERCLKVVEEEEPDDVGTQVRYATYLSYALTDAGELERAERLLRVLVEQTGTLADPYARVRLYWSLGRLTTRDGDPLAGLGHFRRAVTLLEATEDTLHLARAHVSCAWALTKGGKPGEAGPHLEVAETLFGLHIDKADLGWLRTEQAKRAVRMEEPDRAIALAQEALVALGASDPAEQGDAWWAIAEAHSGKGDVDEADAAFRRAVELLVRHRPGRDSAEAYRAWAALLRGAGRDAEALDALDRAAEILTSGAGAESARRSPTPNRGSGTPSY